MANPEHLKILKQGVEAWNNWRKQNPDIEPDLQRADLRGADLREANLSHAFLIRADLRRADLRGADLSGAVLAEDKPDAMAANLTNADLRKTKFTPEGKPVGPGSFLDLASSYGLESARFSKPTLLQDYLTLAFEYAHRADIPEAKKWPGFLESAIKNIRALRSICADQHPPKQLNEVVRTITAELIKYLKQHPKALYQIEPRQFEELIAEILASYNWDVQLTPPTKDGGYDIFAVSKDIEPGLTSSWIIECKKYQPENKVGVDIVRALYGVKANLKAANALLATTSYFTKGANAFKASRYDIELKDYRSILEWINEYRPNPNGKLYIKDNKLILPGEE